MKRLQFAGRAPLYEGLINFSSGGRRETGTLDQALIKKPAHGQGCRYDQKLVPRHVCLFKVVDLLDAKIVNLLHQRP